MFGAPIRREREPYGRLGRPAMRAIVDGMDPEPRRLRLAAAGIEHRHRRVVGVELCRGQNRFPDARHDRIEQGFALARPDRCRCLRRHDLGLAIQGKMVVELRDENVRDHAEARFAARDGLLQSRRLHDPLAGAAGELRPIWRTTLKATGSISSTSSASWPRRRSAPPQAGQTQSPLPGRCTISSRGRCDGKVRSGALRPAATDGLRRGSSASAVSSSPRASSS